MVAAAHMAKAVEKMATWGGYLPYALKEPLGADASRAFADGQFALPTPILPMLLFQLRQNVNRHHQGPVRGF